MEGEDRCTQCYIHRISNTDTIPSSSHYKSKRNRSGLGFQILHTYNKSHEALYILLPLSFPGPNITGNLPVPVLILQRTLNLAKTLKVFIY